MMNLLAACVRTHPIVPYLILCLALFIRSRSRRILLLRRKKVVSTRVAVLKRWSTAISWTATLTAGLAGIAILLRLASTAFWYVDTRIPHGVTPERKVIYEGRLPVYSDRMDCKFMLQPLETSGTLSRVEPPVSYEVTQALSAGPDSNLQTCYRIRTDDGLEGWIGRKSRKGGHDIILPGMDGAIEAPTVAYSREFPSREATILYSRHRPFYRTKMDCLTCGFRPESEKGPYGACAGKASDEILPGQKVVVTEKAYREPDWMPCLRIRWKGGEDGWIPGLGDEIFGAPGALPNDDVTGCLPELYVVQEKEGRPMFLDYRACSGRCVSLLDAQDMARCGESVTLPEGTVVNEYRVDRDTEEGGGAPPQIWDCIRVQLADGRAGYLVTSVPMDGGGRARLENNPAKQRGSGNSERIKRRTHFCASLPGLYGR